MSFTFSAFPAEPRERRRQRLLCFLPAAVSWGLLAGLTATGLAVPSVGAGIIIAFLLYYIIRFAHNTLFLMISFMRIRAEEESDWIARLEDLAPPAGDERPEAGGPVGHRTAARIHAAVLESRRQAKDTLPAYTEIVHLVMVPVRIERRSVYEPGILAVAGSVLDARSSIVVVLAVEERCAEGVLEDARAARDEHAALFRDFLVIVHPSGVVGEVPCKGTNVAHAARLMGPYFAERAIDLSKFLLTSIDADAVVGPEYFACLTYYFLAEPNRTRACFQPLPVFSNNIWRVPSLVRVVEMGETVFQLIDSTNTDLLVTFSCYSYCYRTLYESGFWPADVISEDSAVFWMAFLHFRGDFRAVPLPVTIRMDAAEGPTYWRTLRSAYRQKMRWAYGAENLAIVFRGMFSHGLVKGRRRRVAVLRLAENTVTVATFPVILSVLIWLPQLSRILSSTVALPVFNLGRISGLIFQLTGVFLALIVLVTGLLAYKSAARAPLWKKLLYPLEWLVVLPVSSLVFGAVAALHAQTKLALGKPFAFVTTQKMR
jgi:hypothetical protein